MHVTVVDETLPVLHAVQRVAWRAGAKVSFAGCLAELPLVFDASGFPDVLVANLSEKLTASGVAAVIRRTGYSGRVLAFAAATDGVAAPLEAVVPNVAVCRLPSAGLDGFLRTALLGPEAPQPSEQPTANGSAPSYHGIVGMSSTMRAIFGRMDKVAASDASVCIEGESGTGKEMIALAIHDASSRRDRPFVTLDCTTIPEGLMESHLLGHVKGAFTGAVEHRQGVFSLAHTGTLFIDELSELSFALQSKLLRVVQNREFVPVGGSKPIRSDIRLITASNKDLKQQVENGAFREDLYYRVAVFMITVPPLRERKGDIPLLVDYFLRKFAALHGKPILSVEPAALKRMVEAPWPGNVRQLENLVEQAVVLAEGGSLTEQDLFGGPASRPRHASPDSASPGAYEPGLPLHEVERRHILSTLATVGGRRSDAARLLGISVRCLQYKLKEYARVAQ